jgi:chromate reductase
VSTEASERIWMNLPPARIWVYRHSLMALRQILELGCGALVMPEQVSIPNADDAFDEMDNIIDSRAAHLFRAQLARLVELARLMN